MAAKKDESALLKADLKAIKELNKEQEAKIKELTAQLEAKPDNSAFIKFLDDLDEQLEHYAGRKSEKLRREFKTDLIELVKNTREQLNAQ